MIHPSKCTLFFCGILFFTDGFLGSLYAVDSLSFKRRTMILPRVYNTLEVKTSFSVSFTRLPLDWVETSIDVPIFQLNNKLGLPNNFTLESSFQSIFVSNQIRTGPHWNKEMRNFSFSAGLDGALLFGKMSIAGFDNKAWGWCIYPNISLGFITSDIAFTLSCEYNFLLALKITSGEDAISNSHNFKSGQSVSMFMEQQLWADHILIVGIIHNFQKFYFPAWPAFSTFNRRYYILQLYVGLVL